MHHRLTGVVYNQTVLITDPLGLTDCRRHPRGPGPLATSEALLKFRISCSDSERHCTIALATSLGEASTWCSNVCIPWPAPKLQCQTFSKSSCKTEVKFLTRTSVTELCALGGCIRKLSAGRAWRMPLFEC